MLFALCSCLGGHEWIVIKDCMLSDFRMVGKDEILGEKGTLDYPLIKETLGWYDKRVSIKCYFLGGSIFCKIRRFHQREDPGNEETGQK